MSGTLIAHVDSGKVPYAKLGEYPVPESTGRWKSIAHLELVDTLKNQINFQLQDRPRRIRRLNKGFKLFGVLDEPLSNSG